MIDLKYLRSSELAEKFEFFSYGHAIEILSESFPAEWGELQGALEKFSISEAEIALAGGNESAIPKKFDDVLYPQGWREIKICGDLLIKKFPRLANKKHFEEQPEDIVTITGFIDGHNIDFIKGRIAFDLEWNSKDQTFDRDLLAMRTYFDCSLIDVGVIVTRAQELNDFFKIIKDKNGDFLMRKYGASTTWMGKLIPRLDSRRNGGCPILAVGIKKGCVVDNERLERDYQKLN